MGRRIHAGSGLGFVGFVQRGRFVWRGVKIDWCATRWWMAGELWLNLPVRDVAASRTFFMALGFHLSERWTGDDMACLLFGNPPLVVNLFPEPVFSGFARVPEVDRLTARARAAGARILAEPAEAQGWMYGSAFQDPDGHRWNWLWCDEARMPGPRI